MPLRPPDLELGGLTFRQYVALEAGEMKRGKYLYSGSSRCAAEDGTNYVTDFDLIYREVDT